MVVKTITDYENGRKWEIIKHEENRYSVKYYEFFQSIGWVLTATDRDYTKDCVEFEFDCVVAQQPPMLAPEVTRAERKI